MTKFKPGQRVSFTTTATIAEPGGGAKYIVPSAEAPFDGVLYLVNVDDRNAKVELIPDPDPENWPPQVGDIWKAGEREFYVRQNVTLRSTVVVGAFVFDNSDNSEFYEDSDRLPDFKALKPVLVRRVSDSALDDLRKKLAGTDWEPTAGQRQEARNALSDRASFGRLEAGEQIKAVTDLLNAWHDDNSELGSIESFAYEWFKNSKYAK